MVSVQECIVKCLPRRLTLKSTTKQRMKLDGCVLCCFDTTVSIKYCVVRRFTLVTYASQRCIILNCRKCVDHKMNNNNNHAAIISVLLTASKKVSECMSYGDHSFYCTMLCYRCICRRMCLRVCVCHTPYSIKTAKHRIMQIMPHDSPGNPVF